MPLLLEEYAERGRPLKKTFTLPITGLLIALMLQGEPARAGVRPHGVQVLASTERGEMRGETGNLLFPQNTQIVFESNAGGTLAIPCSAITHTSFATKSNMLKRVAVPAVAAAMFTMGLSLFALFVRGHSYFLAVNYGSGQQAMFSMGKEVYAQDVNAASACTGKPTEILK
jgi:hypothetical protein